MKRLRVVVCRRFGSALCVWVTNGEGGVRSAYSADKRRRAADAGAASVAAPGEPLHARRYNDMAPK